MNHPTTKHGEVIIQKLGRNMPAIWSVKDMIEGKEPDYYPVNLKRSKKYGIVWQFKSTSGATWWQTCNEEPVVAELMAAQFKKPKEKK